MKIFALICFLISSLAMAQVQDTPRTNNMSLRNSPKKSGDVLRTNNLSLRNTYPAPKPTNEYSKVKVGNNINVVDAQTSANTSAGTGATKPENRSIQRPVASTENENTNENYHYQLRGLYSINGRARPVEFTLRWSEQKGKIQGEYRDNYFAPSASVKGSAGERGRSFTIPLNEEIHGVRTIHFLTSHQELRDSATTIPLSVITRDSQGNPLSSVNADGLFSGLSLVAQRQEESRCSQGFGELAGFCGIYDGMISEQEDSFSYCNLISSEAAQLEMTEAGEMILHLGRNPSIVTRPLHHIGRVPSEHGSTIIDVMSRTCRPLPGVTFPDDNCKILNLRGTFSRGARGQRFQGTYTIQDERLNRSCRYGLNLDA